MAPFTYGQYRNPFVGSISDLITRPGEIRAAAAQQAGNAQAQAIQAGGQAWAGAAQNIGQTVAAIPGQINQAHTAALQRQDIQAQILERAAQAKAREAQVASQQRDLAAQASWTKAIQNSIGEDGTVDHEKAAGLVAADGFPVQANTYLEATQKTKSTALQLQEAQQKIEAGKKQAAEAANNHLGELGAMGLDALKKNDPLHARDVTLGLVANAAASGLISADGAKQFMLQSAQASPEQLAQTFQKYLDGAPAVKERMLKDQLTQSEIAKNTAASMKEPTPKSLQAREGFVIRGTTNVPNYNPADGSWSFEGKPVAANQIERAVPVKDPVATALQQIALQTAKEKLTDTQRRSANVSAIAEGMKNGTIPPDPEGLSRQGIYADVIGQMARDGVDFTELRKNYMAAKRLIVTENSPQSVRLDVAVRSGLAMYDKIDALSTQWDGMGLGPLSRANLKVAMEGGKGKAAADLAIQLNGQIAQLTSDVATVEQNGMTPTQESRHVAEQSMQAWWGDSTIQKMTAQGRANMRIRDTARRESVPLVPGQNPSGATPAAPVVVPKGVTITRGTP